MSKRIIQLQVTVDTDGHRGKQYYQIVDGIKSGIEYKNLTSEEKRKLLAAMGISR